MDIGSTEIKKVNHVRSAQHAKKFKHPLSEDEMKQLKTDGKCFLCRRAGHQSRYCPERSKHLNQ